MATRRSWLKNVTESLSNVFDKEDDGTYFFGLQLVIHAFGEDTLRARLAEVIGDPDGALEDVESKRRYFKRIVALLLDQEAYWSQVFWDYKTTRAEVEVEFEAWAAELSAATATEAEEMSADVDGSYRLSKDKDFVSVTLIFKSTAPFPPAEIKDVNLYWQSATVAKLVRGLLLVNPDTIIADGIFVTPGSAEDGLSEEDLLTGGWSYLRVIN